MVTTTALGHDPNDDGSLRTRLSEPMQQMPMCTSCNISFSIDKQKIITDVWNCPLIWEPYKHYEGECQRWQCSNGHYYSFSGWNEMHCCDHESVSDPNCPTNSCSPPQN